MPSGKSDIEIRKMIAQMRPSITMTNSATGEAMSEAREKYLTYVSIERPLSRDEGWDWEESASGTVGAGVAGVSSWGIFESAAARACRR
jgi:hypothetical protein